MTITDLKNSIPDFAKDVKLNFTSLIINSEYDDEVVYGAAYASALALNDSQISKTFEDECRKRFGNDFIISVKSTVVVMTLNNIWYKYRDAMSDPQMKMAPQKMRVNVMANHAGLDKMLFETLSLCISAINGCPFCVRAHTDLLLTNGKTKEEIFNVGRIASVITAMSKSISLK